MQEVCSLARAGAGGKGNSGTSPEGGYLIETGMRRAETGKAEKWEIGKVGKRETPAQNPEPRTQNPEPSPLRDSHLPLDSEFRTPNSKLRGHGRGRGFWSLPPAARARQLRAMDKLEEIFRMQEALNQRIGVTLPPPTDEEKAKWILNYTRAMQQETAELIDSVPWKWWAKYQKFDEQNAKVEVVDLFHFLVSLAQTLGMSADDVYQAYLKKNQVNHQRQDSGYAKKDEADSKHI